MPNHDEFDLDVRFFSSGSTGASGAAQPAFPTDSPTCAIIFDGGHTCNVTCPNTCHILGTCTCNTACGQNTCDCHTLAIEQTCPGYTCQTDCVPCDTDPNGPDPVCNSDACL